MKASRSPRPYMMPWSRSNWPIDSGWTRFGLVRLVFTGRVCSQVFFLLLGRGGPGPKGGVWDGWGGAAAEQSDPGGRRDRHAGCAERWPYGDWHWQWLPAP